MNEKRKTRLFLSYGRRDAAELANRLNVDLEALGYEVWRDTREIRAGKEWEEQISDGLRSTQVVIALLSPHAVRRASDPNSPDNSDSVCLDELTFARFSAPPTPIVPVMAVPCEPPFAVFRLDYVSMTQWMHSEDEYQRGFQRLAAGIEAAASGKPLPFRRWHHCLPVLDFAAQLHEKRRDFVGRQWLFDEIDAWQASSTRERALLIVGDPGIGKSAIVAEMIHRNPGGQVLAYHICRADDPETLRPSTFVMSLAGMIAGRLPAFADLLESPQFQDLFDPTTVSGRPAHVFDQGLLAALHQLPAPPDGIRYLLIDALDEALTLGEGQLNVVTLLSPRMDQFPAWLRIVATTRREPDVLNRLSGLRAASINAHRQDNLNDIDEFIAARLDSPNLAERLTASRVPLATVQRTLREKAYGNFLYVSQALQDIERDNYSFSRLNELPQGLNQWYESWFARKFPNPKVDFVDARTVLEVVVAARDALASDLLAALTGLPVDYDLSQILDSLSGMIVPANDGFRLFHKSIRDWLTTAAARQYRVSAPRGNHRFVQLTETLLSGHAAELPTYLLKHGLWHFAQAVDTYDDHKRWMRLNNNSCYQSSRMKAGMNRVFISYARRDGSELAERLRHDLNASGFRGWMDVAVIQPGMTWADRITEMLDKESDCILMVGTGGHGTSHMCHEELAKAILLGKAIVVLLIDSSQLDLVTDNYPTFPFHDWDDSEDAYRRRIQPLLDFLGGKAP